MKPPIPTYIAHAAEPKSYTGLFVAISIIVIVSVAIFFWVRSSKKTTANDQKVS